MEELEEKLGYRFRDRALLRTALTHSSYANEHRCASNERLEFVGDSVLGMVTAAYLYQHYPELPEGKMTRLRAEIVCEQSLWDVAETLRLGQKLLLGRGEDSSGGRTRPSILADAVEAVIAAVYLDGGFEPARNVIDRYILSKLEGDATALVRDWKTELQEIIQRKPGKTLSYEMTGESGPDHMKRFVSAVSCNGTVIGSFGMADGSMRYGTEITADTLARVRAPEEGVVVYCGRRGDMGLVIDILHDETGAMSRIIGCDKALVELYQRVKQGEQVAAMPEPADSRRVSIRYELLVNGIPVNPEKYLPKK